MINIKCCAGIVTCNPDIQKIIKVVNAVRGQVDFVIIVDNNSSNKTALMELFEGDKKIVFICNNENYGIARALNQLFEVALEKGYDWLMTLDHDTVCDVGMVEVLFDGITGDNVGIVCPNVFYESADLKIKGYGNKGLEEVYACMTSGSLTRVSAWKKVGGFNDDYFIDFVDNEFCMKLKIGGYKVIRNHSCEMRHSLGEPAIVKTLFGEKTVITHKPWRYYYMVRNNLLFINQYKKHLNVMKEYAKLASIICDGLKYSANRKMTWCYIKRGAYDAICKTTGKMKYPSNK